MLETTDALQDALWDDYDVHLFELLVLVEHETVIMLSIDE